MFTGGLDTPPTVTMTGCVLGGTDAGTVKLTCITLIEPGQLPSQILAANLPRSSRRQWIMLILKIKHWRRGGDSNPR